MFLRYAANLLGKKECYNMVQINLKTVYQEYAAK